MEGLEEFRVLAYIALILIILYFLKLLNLAPFDPPQEAAATILGLAVLTLIGESLYSRRTELKEVTEASEVRGQHKGAERAPSQAQDTLREMGRTPRLTTIYPHIPQIWGMWRPHHQSNTAGHIQE